MECKNIVLMLVLLSVPLAGCVDGDTSESRTTTDEPVVWDTVSNTRLHNNWREHYATFHVKLTQNDTEIGSFVKELAPGVHARTWHVETRCVNGIDVSVYVEVYSNGRFIDDDHAYVICNANHTYVIQTREGRTADDLWVQILT